MTLMAEKRFDATRIHTHTFPLADLPTALRYARERIDDAIKVVVTNRAVNASRMPRPSNATGKVRSSPARSG
jgi:L-iditol 2-dehydrogenase